MPAAPLTEAVRRVALVAERGSSVRLSFEPGKVIIEAGTKGQARARETVAADFSGEESAIAFSPQYLLDGLSAALVRRLRRPAPAAHARSQRPGPPGAGRCPGAGRRADPPAVHQPDQAGPDHRQLGRRRRQAAPDYRYLVVPLRSLASA